MKMYCLVSKVSIKYKKYNVFASYEEFKAIPRREYSHQFQNFSRNLNVDGPNKCREMVSRKISLFSKMQRGRSPSFELLQLDMYGES